MGQSKLKGRDYAAKQKGGKATPQRHKEYPGIQQRGRDKTNGKKYEEEHHATASSGWPFAMDIDSHQPENKSAKDERQ